MDPLSNLPSLSSSCTRDDDDNDASEKVYEVEEILSDRKVDGKKHFLVRWVGFSDEENSWEPRESFASCPKFLEEYELRKREEKKEMVKMQKKLREKMISKKTRGLAKKQSSSRGRSDASSSRQRTPHIDSLSESSFDQESRSTSKDSRQQRSSSTSSRESTPTKSDKTSIRSSRSAFLANVLRQIRTPKQGRQPDPNALQIYATKMYFQQLKPKPIETDELLPNEELPEPSECGFMKGLQVLRCDNRVVFHGGLHYLSIQFEGCQMNQLIEKNIVKKYRADLYANYFG